MKKKGFKRNVAGKKVRNLTANLKRFWKEPPTGRYMNFKEIACLGSASLGVSFITNLINMYVTIGQLPLIYNLGDYGTLHATVIYLTACIGGLLLTPVYGKLVQRTKGKLGRYKPFILFLAPVVAILGAASVWSPENLGLNERIAYVYAICIPTLLVWNLWFNSFNMFPGVMTPNRQERVDIWSPIGLVMGFAPTLMNVLKDLFAGIWGDVVAARIFGILSAVVGVLCVIGLLGVKERVFVTEKENENNRIGIWKSMKMVVKNRPLMILTLALALGCMKGTIDMVWHIVARVKYAENMADAAKIFGAVSLIVGFAATPNMLLLPWLTRKLNNRSILIFWQTLNTAAYLVLACVGFQNLGQGTWSAILITGLRFVAAFNAMGSLQPLMLSEIGDYQQKLSGYRLDGFLQTFAYSIPLVVTQACALIPAIIQGKIGFNPNNYIITDGSGGIPTNEMPQNILSGELISVADRYANIAVWISVISGALMIGCLLFYNLDKKKHAAVIRELEENSVNSEEILKEEGELKILDLAKEDCAEESAASGSRCGRDSEKEKEADGVFGNGSFGEEIPPEKNGVENGDGTNRERKCGEKNRKPYGENGGDL